jgi:hypothetical protein
LTNYLSVAKNGPNAINQNRPIKQLDHSYGRGKWISDNELQELAQKNMK